MYGSIHTSNKSSTPAAAAPQATSSVAPTNTSTPTPPTGKKKTRFRPLTVHDANNLTQSGGHQGSTLSHDQAPAYTLKTPAEALESLYSMSNSTEVEATARVRYDKNAQAWGYSSDKIEEGVLTAVYNKANIGIAHIPDEKFFLYMPPYDESKYVGGVRQTIRHGSIKKPATFSMEMFSNQEKK